MGLAHNAALVGSGTVSSAALSLIAQVASDLVGAGAITGANLDAASQMACNLAGAGDLVGALQILAGMTASIIGAGSVTADATGILSMGADIDSAGDLVTAQTCAAAVWNSTASAFNDASTMGNLQNQALTTGKFIALK